MRVRKTRGDTESFIHVTDCCKLCIPSVLSETSNFIFYWYRKTTTKVPWISFGSFSDSAKFSPFWTQTYLFKCKYLHMPTLVFLYDILKSNSVSTLFMTIDLILTDFIQLFTSISWLNDKSLNWVSSKLAACFTIPCLCMWHWWVHGREWDTYWGMGRAWWCPCTDTSCCMHL